MKQNTLGTILGLGLAALSCGGVKQESEDHCGNSPAYGKILWEISGCKWSLHMREDCVVGAADKNESYYNYDRGISEKYEGEMTLYNGSELRTSSGIVLYILDHNARFTPESSPYAERLNHMLDLYDGFVGIENIDHSNATRVDDNAFITRPEPYRGETACRATPFYAGNGR